MAAGRREVLDIIIAVAEKPLNANSDPVRTGNVAGLNKARSPELEPGRMALPKTRLLTIRPAHTGSGGGGGWGGDGSIPREMDEETPKVVVKSRA
jgi:hypothetical protein